jgi:hypothetical protein
MAVERLLSQGADPDEPDWAGSGDAPLLHAAAAGSVQVVRCIVIFLVMCFEDKNIYIDFPSLTSLLRLYSTVFK